MNDVISVKLEHMLININFIHLNRQLLYQNTVSLIFIPLEQLPFIPNTEVPEFYYLNM